MNNIYKLIHIYLLKSLILETFGTCDDGCCKFQDAPCNLQCKENICHYDDWVFQKHGRKRCAPKYLNNLFGYKENE